MTAKPRIAIIIGSTRPTRFADAPAQWILKQAQARGRHGRRAGRPARPSAALLRRGGVEHVDAEPESRGDPLATDGRRASTATSSSSPNTTTRSPACSRTRSTRPTRSGPASHSPPSATAARAARARSSTCGDRRRAADGLDPRGGSHRRRDFMAVHPAFGEQARSRRSRPTCCQRRRRPWTNWSGGPRRPWPRRRPRWRAPDRGRGARVRAPRGQLGPHGAGHERARSHDAAAVSEGELGRTPHPVVRGVEALDGEVPRPCSGQVAADHQPQRRASSARVSRWSTCTNGWNTRAIWSAAMPRPMSRLWSATRSRSADSPTTASRVPDASAVRRGPHGGGIGPMLVSPATVRPCGAGEHPMGTASVMSTTSMRALACRSADG